jgi:uncharacterized membrane-anchored protein
MVDMLQTLRLVFVYPVLTASGLVWLIGFYLRYRHTHCTGDRWSMLAGAAMLAMGAMGLIALWTAGLTGFSAITSGMFTVGLVIMAALGLVGALRLFWGAWRLAGRNNKVETT